VLWHEAARPDDHVQRQWAKNADLKPSNRNVDFIDRPRYFLLSSTL
jgi:hypothetical protein